MTSRCLCTVCRKLFDAPGGILFTAPDTDQMRTEFHVCPPPLRRPDHQRQTNSPRHQNPKTHLVIACPVRLLHPQL